MTTSRSQPNPSSFDTGDLGLTKIDRLIINQNEGFFGITKPVTVSIPDTDAATAARYTTPFFIADRSYEVISVVERHKTAGSAGGTVTVTVEKVPSGTAVGSGTDILTAGIDLKATANTNQEGSINQGYSGSTPVRRITRSDCLVLKTSGTLTSVNGVTVSVLLRSI